MSKADRCCTDSKSSQVISPDSHSTSNHAIPAFPTCVLIDLTRISPAEPPRLLICWVDLPRNLQLSLDIWICSKLAWNVSCTPLLNRSLDSAGLYVIPLTISSSILYGLIYFGDNFCDLPFNIERSSVDRYTKSPTANEAFCLFWLAWNNCLTCWVRIVSCALMSPSHNFLIKVLTPGKVLLVRSHTVVSVLFDLHK